MLRYDSEDVHRFECNHLWGWGYTINKGLSESLTFCFSVINCN